MAGLDTSIPLGIKPIDFGDPNEGRMNALRAQLLQMQMQQGQFNMMKAQRDMQYQDQQRAQAAAAAAAQKAKEEAARREFMAAYNATGNVNVPIPAQVAEPGAASDVGMLGSQNAMAEYKPSSMMMTQPKDLGAATNALIQGGKFDAANLGMGYNTAVTEAEKKKIELGKAKSEASSAEAKAIDENLKPFRSYAASVNSPEAAAAYVSAMFDHPVLGSVAQKISGQTKDQAVAAAMRDYAADPQRWMAAHVGLTGEQVMSALSGGGEGEKGIALTDAAGNVRIVNPKTAKQIGETIPAAGKPSGAYEKTQAQKQAMKVNIESTINALDEIAKPGGLIEQSTGSRIGAGVDWLAESVGKATPGSIAIARLTPIADKVLKMVPRFEGPQSDRDVKSYEKAGGDLANPYLPVARRVAAAKEIARLMRERKDQFVDKDALARGDVMPEAPASGPSVDDLLKKYGG